MGSKLAPVPIEMSAVIKYKEDESNIMMPSGWAAVLLVSTGVAKSLIGNRRFSPLWSDHESRRSYPVIGRDSTCGT